MQHLYNIIILLINSATLIIAFSFVVLDIIWFTVVTVIIMMPGQSVHIR